MSYHIYAPRGYYIGQIRKAGGRRWTTVTGQCRKDIAAMASAVKKMVPGYTKARVLFITRNGYFEPILVMECSR